MAREDLSGLTAFVAVAQLRSFTKAAVQLGVSQSALSHAMRELEDRLGVRLLARTTRSVTPTEAGEALLQGIGPHLDAIETELATLQVRRDQPAGVIRLTSADHAAVTILYPAIARLARGYPDIKIELSVDNSQVDIVANRFDAGVHIGRNIERDMIAMRIGPDLRAAIVGSPSYFERYGTPHTPEDLVNHKCINIRLPTYGNLVPWRFEKSGREVTVRVEGQLTFNVWMMGLRAVLDGLGLACSHEDLVAPHIIEGRLVRVLHDWCPLYPGYHLYYPSRRQLSPAFSLFLKALRATQQ